MKAVHSPAWKPVATKDSPEIVQTWLNRWLKQRLPKAQQTTLNQRQIFIVPARLALGMLLLVVLLFVLGINFQNSLVYAVCFWLLAMLVINILHTYRNLSGLTIKSIGIEPCFAGENAVLEVELSRPAKQRKYAIALGWPEHDMAEVNLVEQQNTRIRLSHPTARRGRFAVPRLKVETYYPTRLAVAWSYIIPDMTGLVYPEPKLHSLPDQAVAANADSGGKEVPAGSNDFGGIRDYQPSDTPRHIHWGKYAQTGELYTKAFVDYAADELWLDWDALPFSGTEARLSHLCQRILDCHAEQRQYGLLIPGMRIEPASGEAHKSCCLSALALFEVAA